MIELITINAWGGRVKEFDDFIDRQSKTTDIFCMQEVFHHGKTSWGRQAVSRMDLFERIQEILPMFDGFFHHHQDDQEGLAMFTRRGLGLKTVDSEFVFRWKGGLVSNDPKTMPRVVQFAEFRSDTRDFGVVNFHGLWNGQGKFDSVDRIDQSKKLRSVLNSIKYGKVLAGDFNLRPDTESIKILERGMVNLVTENGVTNTRSSFYQKSERFADYILVSEGLSVKKFEVRADEVSDHLPLLVQFE